MSPEPAPAATRRFLYILLTLLALVTLTARIAQVQAKDRRTPFLSANDRSRWCTIASLVDYGTYEIDRVIARPGWDTIDKVYHAGPDGEKHFYSSKPTLLTTLLAWEYWFVKQVTGASLLTHTFYVGRIMIWLTNVLPLLVYFAIMLHLIEQWGTTHWGRIYAAVALTFGTFLTTFGVTLNNHLPAAWGVAITLYALWQIVSLGRHHWSWFAVAGSGAAWTAANELPALAWLVAAGAICLGIAPLRAILGFGVPAALVVAGFFATNYQAHQSLKPAYMHRDAEDNWYDYPGTYWADGERKGIDRGEPSRLVYTRNMLIGHHGIFSLSPIWILSVWGAVLWFRDRDRLRWLLAGGTVALTVICCTFYVMRPEIDRNYGGVSCGFRWMFWFTPLWMVLLLPAADRLVACRWGITLLILCLGVSVFSAHYAALHPWAHPWIYAYWQYIGWIPQ